MEPFRPPQKTPIDNFFLAGSYTQQDYIDSMWVPPASDRAIAAFPKLNSAVKAITQSEAAEPDGWSWELRESVLPEKVMNQMKAHCWQAMWWTEVVRLQHVQDQ